MFRIQVLSYSVSYLRETISAHWILLTRIGLVKHEKLGPLKPVNFPKLLKLIEGVGAFTGNAWVTFDT